MTILGSLLNGRVLAGRYKLTSMLGRGGMGAVFEAHDQHLERTVAIKIIAIGLADTQAEEDLRKRFYREARSAARLQHPHLVTVYDLRTDDETGIDFIVMERLKGEDLEKRLERGVSNEVDWVLEVLLQAADALGAAHAGGLVHRDVKPANLFLEAGIAPRVRLMDFGIALVEATLQDSAPRLSRYGPPMTPAYAAPELLQGQLDVGPPCDVFSLAATGYELLTGERPFTDDELEMIASGWAGRPASVDNAPNVPADLAAVLEKALAHDATARFADANEFADALRAIQAARAVAVTPVHPPTDLDTDQLRFHLTAVETVSRALAVVRGAEEAERLVLDSIGEIFGPWWVALYHTDGDQYSCRAVRSVREATVTYTIPARVVRTLGTQGQEPVIVPEDAEIRDHISEDLAVVAPLDFGEGDAGLLILGRRVTSASYEHHDLALLRSLAEMSAIALRNSELLDRLRDQAVLDPLTACYNRRGCDEFLQATTTQAKRYGQPLCLVLLEIDWFQRFRDDFGHEAAEIALQRIGRALRYSSRDDDRACRLDGAEFALVLKEADKDMALRLVERLRILVESLPPNAEVPRTLTASFGVAALPEDGDNLPDLWNSARTALNQAKAGGGNRIC